MSPEDHPPITVLLRSSWQTVNIGDVAHTPGAALGFQRFAPQVRIIHWPVHLDRRERDMVARTLPEMRIVDGVLGEGGELSPEVAAAWDEADVFVHGSCAHLGIERELRVWRERTGKPYSYFGVTHDPMTPTWGTLTELETMVDALPVGYLDQGLHAVLDDADVVLARDSITLSYLRQQGVTPRHLDFGPDGTFAFDLRDDPAAHRTLTEHGLQPDEFACFVPRVRYTPYAQIHGTEPTREQHRRAAVNAATTGRDLQTLASSIAAWVRASDQMAFVVPEMSYAVGVAQHELTPLLAEDIVDRVRILDRFWPLEEAVGVYAQSSAVISIECHSPILASALGVPTVYLRQPTDTVKGRMFSDLGGSSQVIEIDDAVAAVAAVEAIAADPRPATRASGAMHTAAMATMRRGVEAIIAGAEAGRLRREPALEQSREAVPKHSGESCPT